MTVVQSTRLVRPSVRTTFFLMVFLGVASVDILWMDGGRVHAQEVPQQLLQQQGLSVDFYNATCPSAEQVVRDALTAHFMSDPNVAAHLLRLQFHDCAATGCDASILLNGTNSEQEAIPNLTVVGYSVIEDIKSQVETNCTGVVSCADILAMAARDSVFLTGGPDFRIPLGRYDANYSGGSNVMLPAPFDSVPKNLAFMNNMGLNTLDTVALLGAHSIGAAHCSSFNDRLFNFNNTGLPDPTLSPTFLAYLQEVCPQGTAPQNATVALDIESEYIFDSHYYLEMVENHGVLQIDGQIASHNLTAKILNDMSANTTFFFDSFTTAMIKMGQYGVKNATTGLIRTQCFQVPPSFNLTTLI